MYVYGKMNEALAASKRGWDDRRITQYLFLVVKCMFKILGIQ